MTNQVTLFQQEANAQLSKKFQPLVAAGYGTDLGDGIKGSYGIIGIKAGKFRLKYKGEETVLTNPADGMPVGYIDVVIVKANPFLNKQYFEGKYAEGVTAPPVCYSLDGVKPSDASKSKQAASCALCPKNQFGSLIGENGVKQKACRDTKKLAVVPLADIRNLTMGGAMLFRVPPSSLKDLSVMADQLKGRGYPYNSVAVRISFDLEASHPKPIFRALRPLDDGEADQVLEMFESDSVQRVLADNDVVVDHGEEAVASAPAPVQPAQQYDPRRDDTSPRPQAAPMLAGTPGVDPPIAGIAPKPLVMPEVVPQPRVLPLAPDVPPPPAAVAAAPVNPFAGVNASAGAAEQAAKAAAPASPAANPFAPPPAKKAAPRKAATPPVTVEAAAPAVEEAQMPVQLESDINNILKGLDM